MAKKKAKVVKGSKKKATKKASSKKVSKKAPSKKAPKEIDISKGVNLEELSKEEQISVLNRMLQNVRTQRDQIAGSCLVGTGNDIATASQLVILMEKERYFGLRLQSLIKQAGE